jgi:uncharacterized protein
MNDFNDQADRGEEERRDSASDAPRPAKRGFAAMSREQQREIARKGGKSQGRQNNPGNFANDREKARVAGRKGGESHGVHR